MAKKTRISYLEAKNLSNCFSHAKYRSPCILARLLLEAFIFDDGNITSDWFVREKVCLKGAFTRLRERLIKEQWLHFRDDSKRYFPGSRLKPHLDGLKEMKLVTQAQFERLNDQKADRSELLILDEKKVDKADLEVRLAETNSRINAIAVAVRELQDAMLPPDTPEKKAVRERSAKKIALLAH
jgi:hypothetical protein